MEEPSTKRAIAFFDGQNLYRHAKAAFGHYHPNYDLKKLFAAVCVECRCVPKGIRFYTGTPVKRSGILVTSRLLRYQTAKIKLPDGSEQEVTTEHEKGIDVRLALDVVRLAREKQFDVAVIFSQDQDLSEVVTEVKGISAEQNRWIRVICAYPSGPSATANRGIDGAQWFKMERPFYDGCLDPRDYRPKRRISTLSP